MTLIMDIYYHSHIYCIFLLYNIKDIGFWKPTPNATQYGTLALAVGAGIRGNSIISNEIGCSCLFIWTFLYFIIQPKQSKQPQYPSSIHNNNNISSPIHPTPTQQTRSNQTPSIPKSTPSKSIPSPNLSPSKRMIQSPSKSLRNKLILSTSSNQDISELYPSTNDDEIVHKRQDYLDWDEYFLSVSMLSAMRSKDPSTQVGACIVNINKRIVGIGYNGFPVGCSDDKLPWNRTSNKGENYTKYPYVCHAEMNAILNKNSSDCNNCTMYVVLFPCNECAKLIIQSGIKRIIYICDKYAKTDTVIASKRLLNMAQVAYKQHIPKQKSILITFPDH